MKKLMVILVLALATSAYADHKKDHKKVEVHDKEHAHVTDDKKDHDHDDKHHQAHDHKSHHPEHTEEVKPVKK